MLLDQNVNSLQWFHSVSEIGHVELVVDYDLDLKNIYTLSNLSSVDSGGHVVGMDVDND